MKKCLQVPRLHMIKCFHVSLTLLLAVFKSLDSVLCLLCVCVSYVHLQNYLKQENTFHLKKHLCNLKLVTMMELATHYCSTAQSIVLQSVCMFVSMSSSYAETCSSCLHANLRKMFYADDFTNILSHILLSLQFSSIRSC